MADFLAEKKKQKYLIWLVVFVIIATVIILWYGFFRDQGQTVVAEPVLIEEITINFELLENEIFDDLKIFEKSPSFEGETGRSNPFLP